MIPMKHRTILAALTVCALCALASPAATQAQGYDDDDDRYDDRHRFALALGAGIVEPENEGEIYYMAAFRIGLYGDRDGDHRSGDDWRRSSRGDVQAYIEPEIGYWERSDRGRSDTDLLLGVNAVGVVPGRFVDYFFGVGLGLHFFDTTIDAVNTVPAVNQSDEKLGGNFQVGLDIHITESTSVFGTGRFDVIEGLDDTLQGKVYMGLRFRF